MIWFLDVLTWALRRRCWCWFHGHSPREMEASLGGWWIECVVCGAVEECLPGIHEPWGCCEDSSR